MVDDERLHLPLALLQFQTQRLDCGKGYQAGIRLRDCSLRIALSSQLDRRELDHKVVSFGQSGLVLNRTPAPGIG